MKHVERSGVLLHLIDITQDDIIRAYEIIRNEMEEYGLENKVEVIALSKCDSLSEEDIKEKQALLAKHTKQNIYTISSISKQGVTVVLRKLREYIDEFRLEQN